MLPILYSYRRCPYAMRARMALKLVNIDVEIREVSLRNKPAHMLQVSPKATVPVLILPDGSVIEESLEIMLYALKKHSLQPSIHAACRPALECFSPVAYDSEELVLENDTRFKQALDAYKYPERFPNKTQSQHRESGEVFLQKLENLLNKNTYLLEAAPTLADMAIFPFVRQFAAVDGLWFENSAYPKLRAWLNEWADSELFKSVMTKNPTFIE